MRRALPLVALLLLPGCTLLEEPAAKELSGPTDGYTPTNTFLKVHVRRDDGSVALLDFDRRDWYTSEIAKRIDRREVSFLSAQAMPRDILGEYLVQHVAAPGELQALRYDEMGASPEMRAQMDAEHDALLRDLEAKLRETVPPPAADAPLKTLSLS